MKTASLFRPLACAALLAVPVHAQLYSLHGDGVKKADRVVEKADYSDYELVWNDEFDKDGRPDPAKWNYENGFVRNKEAQWYQPENAYCKDGMLIIEGRKEKRPNPRYNPEGKDWRTTRKEAEYTSASLTTQGKFSWQYGRFEIRARFSPREGMWPAFWTLGVREGWPRCGEIDIMEHVGNQLNRIFGTLHYPGRSGGNADGTSVMIPNATTEFHIYSMEWNASTIKIYVDNQLFFTYNNNANSPFNQNFFFIMNVAMGGNFGGTIDPNVTNATMEVDYIRVYQ